jgi:HlyD family secretion protein
MRRTNSSRRGGAALKLIVALAAVGAASWGAIALWGGKSAGAPRLPTAELVPVVKTSFDIATTATGELQAKNQIELRSEVEGETTIAELVAEGTFVHKDDLVIRLNTDQIQSQLDEAELRVASAKSDLVASDKGYEIQQSENDSKIREAQLKLDLAQLALDQWDKGEKVQKLKDLDLALDKTEQDLARLKDKSARSDDLFKEGFLSKNDLDLDHIALREADAARAKAVLDADTYKTYQMPKDQKQKTSDVEEAKAELARTKQQAEIQLAIKAADKFNKQRTLALHEEKLDKLKKQVAAATIKAPQDGLVVYATSAGRNWRDDSPFVVGRKVYPQESLIVLPDTSVMVAAVRVHETLAGRVKPGQSATVKIDAYPGRVFTGIVDSIGVMAETQGRWLDPNRREYTIKIALEKPDDDIALKPAMRCEATITLGRVEEVPTVPLQAVFSDDLVKFVYVPSGSKYARVPVQVGRRSETMAEISAGVQPGAKVLVREPAAGEILRTPWDESQLKLVGFKLGSDGKPAPLAEPKPDKPQRTAAAIPGAGAGGSPARGAPAPSRAPAAPAK